LFRIIYKKQLLFSINNFNIYVMGIIKKYDGFINENMDQARSLIAKKMDAFDKLKSLLSKNLGYIGKFTEYLLNENIKYEDLVELYNQILDLKSKLKSWLDFVEEKNKHVNKKTAEEDLNSGEIRLNRFIANAGICSRREADTLISAGLVTINGKAVTEMGYKIKAGDDIRYNGQRLSVEAKIYILMNKPKDAITTASDPEGRNTVFDLIEGKLAQRVFAVGRLDRNTTGVLLLTNDGDLAQRLTHPKFEVEKVYVATLNKPFTKADMWQLASGIELEDGPIAPDALAYSEEERKDIIGVEIHSGRNRIIHRMFEHMGYLVDKLDRVAYAGLTKSKLKRGEWRELTDKELKMVKKIAKMG
jgi:23S rRNA pseudouridine2605 synthase